MRILGRINFLCINFIISMLTNRAHRSFLLFFQLKTPNCTSSGCDIIIFLTYMYICGWRFTLGSVFWYHLNTSTDKRSTDKRSTDKRLTDKRSKIEMRQKVDRQKVDRDKR
jgi:hypothetical protein